MCRQRHNLGTTTSTTTTTTTSQLLNVIFPCLFLLFLTTINHSEAFPLQTCSVGNADVGSFNLSKISSSSLAIPKRRRLGNGAAPSTTAIGPPSSLSTTTTTTTTTTQLQMSMFSRDDDLEGTDKYKACVPYVLPLLDGEKFGNYIYERVPPLGFLDGLFIGPLHEIYSQFDWLGLLLFCALTLGTRFNTDMNRNVRFNAQQAAMISATLVVPELIAYSFVDEDIPRYIVEPCSNFVWYTYMSMCLYSIYNNLRGKKPDAIPYVSNLSELLVGPF